MSTFSDDCTSQGTSVSFDGQPIGYLRSFDEGAEIGQLDEVTGDDARIVGSGADARVVRQYDCTEIDPPKLSFTFFGASPFTEDDVGSKGELVFSAPGDTISGEAILMRWNYSGSAGQYAEGSCEFQLTGA